MNGRVFKRCQCGTAKNCKKPHGSWYFHHDLPVLPGQSRRSRLTRGGFRTKEQASEALATSLAQFSQRGLAMEHDVQGRREHLATYLPEWLDGRPKLKRSTRRSYDQHIQQYLIPHLGHLRLEELSDRHINAMLVRLRQPGSRKNGKDRLSPASIRRIHATLRKALNDAVRRHLITTNPACLVELESTPFPRAKYWTSTQAGRFLDAIVDDRLYALYHLTLHRGPRRGEVLGLRWEDVDLEQQTVDIHRSRIQLGDAVVDDTPKSEASIRVLSLDRETVLALEAHRARQEREFARLDRKVRATDFVFTREDGEPLHPQYVSNHLGILIQHAEVPRITFHQLRHTAASLMLEAGADIKYVQHVLGHEDMFITARIYAHVTARLDRERSGQVANLIPRRRRAAPPHAYPGDTTNEDELPGTA